jgi:hypothetical protein
LIYARMPRQRPVVRVVSRGGVRWGGESMHRQRVCGIYMHWASVLVWVGSVSFPAQFRTLSRALSLSSPVPLCPSVAPARHPFARPHTHTHRPQLHYPHTHTSPQGTMTAPGHLPFSNFGHPSTPSTTIVSVCDSVRVLAIPPYRSDPANSRPNLESGFPERRGAPEPAGRVRFVILDARGQPQGTAGHRREPQGLFGPTHTDHTGNRFYPRG